MEDGIVEEDKTTINHSTVIEGNIKAKEHLVINGTIIGSVEIKGFKLFLGPSGRLEGEVHAKDVRIRGHMKGDIKATGIVQITKEANYSGKIESKGISVEQGAYFDAFVNLGRSVSETKAQKGT
jgi:cytoskeletal protein CcmA (bactofilin family)